MVQESWIVHEKTLQMGIRWSVTDLCLCFEFQMALGGEIAILKSQGATGLGQKHSPGQAGEAIAEM